MPFTTLTQIKPFIPNPVYNFLAMNNNFQSLEYQASCLVRDICDIPFPPPPDPNSEIENLPDYIHYPMALIIHKLTIPFFPDLDPTSIEVINAQYLFALEYLSKVKNSPLIFSSTFTESQTW